MPFYEEFPFDPVVNVHWKKRGPKPEPCGPLPPVKCLSYTNLGNIPFTGGSVDRTVIYGDAGSVGSCTIDGIDTHPPQIIDLGTASTQTDFVIVDLDGTLSFTNRPLGAPYGCVWNTPLVSGQICQQEGTSFFPVGIVAETIRFDAAFHPSTGIVWGVGVSHPLTDGTAAIPPPGPNMFVGNSGSFTYDMHWKEHLTFEITVTTANQFDPTLGGPTVFWRMGSTDGGASWVQAFGGFCADGETWTVTATCMIEPSLFGTRASNERFGAASPRRRISRRSRFRELV